MGRTLFCDDTCDECVRHGGAGIARLARPTAPGRRRCSLILAADLEVNATGWFFFIMNQPEVTATEMGCKMNERVLGPRGKRKESALLFCRRGTRIFA